MQTLPAIGFALCLTSVSAATDFDPFKGPKPALVYIQSDPWATVIGSDTPRIAVYENGDVVFAKKVGERLVYHQVMLDEDRLKKVRERFQRVLSLDGLKPSYNIRPSATDQPKAMFYLRGGDHDVATSVYGLKSAGTSLPANTELPIGPKATAPPRELLELHKWLSELDYPRSKEWKPKYVEVMLWDYAYAPEASIHWPRDWPSLASDRTIKRGDSYSLFLDGSLLTDLKKFLSTQNEKGAIEIEGKKMTASYRYTFPSERVWRKAFAAAARRAARE